VKPTKLSFAGDVGFQVDLLMCQHPLIDELPRCNSGEVTLGMAFALLPTPISSSTLKDYLLPLWCFCFHHWRVGFATATLLCVIMASPFHFSVMLALVNNQATGSAA
jgi:hypothetical protein